MPVVPVELFRPIIKSVNERDKKTLLSVVLSCHTLRAEAEQVLYRAVQFGGGRRRTSFLNTVVTNERLALLVRELNLFQTKEDQKDNVYWDLHSSALRALKNLKSLNFQRNALLPSAHILRECSFQLERLIWGCERDEKETSRFLCTQQNLKVLSVLGLYDPIALPPYALPILSVLMGHGHAISPLIKGRKITHLRQSGGDFASPDDLQDIRVLVLGDYQVPFSGLFRFSEILVNLNIEYLELICIPVSDLYTCMLSYH